MLRENSDIYLPLNSYILLDLQFSQYRGLVLVVEQFVCYLCAIKTEVYKKTCFMLRNMFLSILLLCVVLNYVYEQQRIDDTHCKDGFTNLQTIIISKCCKSGLYCHFMSKIFSSVTCI